MTANAGYHAYATGDVLTAAQVQYNLQNQTTMYFASSAARTTALSGVLVEGMVSYIPANGIEYYNGSAWVSISQAVTALTTKGDLLTYSTTDTRLPVGSDGQTLVVNSSQTTGLAYTNNFAAGKNKIINGDMGIWQRGITFTTTSNTYTADRWTTSKDGSGTVTTSQQTFTAGTAPVSGYEGTYFLQLATSVLGTTTYTQLQQRIEDVRTFAGQTVTVSFWAKLSSGTIGSAYVRLNQNFGSGGSAGVSGSANNYTPTGSWQRFSATVTLASISGKTIGTGSFLEVDFVTPFTATNTMQFWGVQVEAGSVATAFQTATGTIQGELAACQRYYWQSPSTVAYTPYGFGSFISTSVFQAPVKLPVSMRIIPTLATSNALAANNGSAAALTSVTVVAAQSSVDIAYISASGTGILNASATLANNNNTSGYLGLSAEL